MAQGRTMVLRLLLVCVLVHLQHSCVEAATVHKDKRRIQALTSSTQDVTSTAQTQTSVELCSQLDVGFAGVGNAGLSFFGQISSSVQVERSKKAGEDASYTHLSKVDMTGGMGLTLGFTTPIGIGVHVFGDLRIAANFLVNNSAAWRAAKRLLTDKGKAKDSTSVKREETKTTKQEDIVILGTDEDPNQLVDENILLALLSRWTVFKLKKYVLPSTDRDKQLMKRLRAVWDEIVIEKLQPDAKLSDMRKHLGDTDFTLLVPSMEAIKAEKQKLDDNWWKTLGLKKPSEVQQVKNIMKGSKDLDEIMASEFIKQAKLLEDAHLKRVQEFAKKVASVTAKAEELPKNWDDMVLKRWLEVFARSGIKPDDASTMSCKDIVAVTEKNLMHTEAYIECSLLKAIAKASSIKAAMKELYPELFSVNLVSENIFQSVHLTERPHDLDVKAWTSPRVMTSVMLKMDDHPEAVTEFLQGGEEILEKVFTFGELSLTGTLGISIGASTVGFCSRDSNYLVNFYGWKWVYDRTKKEFGTAERSMVFTITVPGDTAFTYEDPSGKQIALYLKVSEEEWDSTLLFESKNLAKLETTLTGIVNQIIETVDSNDEKEAVEEVKKGSGDLRNAIFNGLKSIVPGVLKPEGLSLSDRLRLKLPVSYVAAKELVVSVAWDGGIQATTNVTIKVGLLDSVQAQVTAPVGPVTLTLTGWKARGHSVLFKAQLGPYAPAVVAVGKSLLDSFKDKISALVYGERIAKTQQEIAERNRIRQVAQTDLGAISPLHAPDTQR